MEKIELNGELIFTLNNKQEWIDKVPRILPSKNRSTERFLWIDANGDVFESGSDFSAAEQHGTFPCKVYRTRTVEQAHFKK